MTTNLKLLNQSAFDHKIKLEQQTKKSMYRLSIKKSRAQNQAVEPYTDNQHHTYLSKNGILSLVPCTGKLLCLFAIPRLLLQKLVAWKCQYLKT